MYINCANFFGHHVDLMLLCAYTDWIYAYCHECSIGFFLLVRTICSVVTYALSMYKMACTVHLLVYNITLSEVSDHSLMLCHIVLCVYEIDI